MGCFCGFFAESCCRPFFDVPNRYIVPGNFWDGVQTVMPWHIKVWQTQAKGSKSQSSRRRPDAAGGKAFRRFLAHLCCCLFFPLGFKFCCIVLRVANARDLIIDLRRLCYLQLKLTRITVPLSESDPTISCTLSSQRWLIAQFEHHFDAALGRSFQIHSMVQSSYRSII